VADLLCMLGYPALFYYILVQGEARWELRWGDDGDYTDDADELRKLARLDSAQE
jgi:hypothetical protein